MSKEARSRRAGGSAGKPSADLRELYNEGVQRQLAGLNADDPGRVQTAVVEHPDGDAPVEVDSDKREVRIWARDVVTGHPVLVTLFAPANAIWRKPQADDTVTVVTGSLTGGPSAGTALHGDGGHADDVPEELDDTNLVISPPTGDVIMRSRDGEILIRGDAQVTVKLGDSTMTLSSSGISIDAAAGLNVNINAGAGANVVVNGGVRSVAADGDLAGMYPIKAAVPTFKTL